MKIKLFFYPCRQAIHAYNSIPPSAGMAIQASIFTFIILNYMPLHPLAILVSFGGGLSMAITGLSIFRLFQK